jgi:hypothetical protein
VLFLYQKGGTKTMDRDNYCKDCKRSMWGDKSCDTNIENNGKYTLAGNKCYCKIGQDGKMSEKYSWEE